MARRRLARAGGFVHDIETVISLSSEPANIRLLSDRSLYLLQNLSLEDITFRSRYGEILSNGFYLPVTAGSAEDADVQDAVDLVRRDLNSMGVEELLECICKTNTILVEQGAEAGSAVDAISSDGEVATGEGEQFPDQESYFDAKCNIANAVFDTILGLIDWLDDNDVDLLAGLFGGVTSGLLVGVALAGPVGWAWLLGGALVTSVAGYIVRLTVNFSDLSAALSDTHDACVLGLYNASDAITAEQNFIAAVEAGSPAITAVESGLLGLLIPADLVNNLFSPRSDMVSYSSPDPVDCGSAVLQTWSFEASGEGWAFRDDSTGTYSASGVWVGAREAWEVTIVGLGTGPGPSAEGTVYITGLSLAIPAGGSVQMDHSATGDGVIASRQIKVIFSDMSEQVERPASTKTAGTVVMTVPVAKTISEIEVTFGRNWSFAFDTNRDAEEVRVIGV